MLHDLSFPLGTSQHCPQFCQKVAKKSSTQCQVKLQITVQDICCSTTWFNPVPCVPDAFLRHHPAHRADAGRRGLPRGPGGCDRRGLAADHRGALRSEAPGRWMLQVWRFGGGGGGWIQWCREDRSPLVKGLGCVCVCV